MFRAQISNDDGATWTTVETVGPSGAEASGEWLEGGFLMDAVVPLTSTMRVQFIAEDKASQGSLIETARQRMLTVLKEPDLLSERHQ